jgi:pyruvate/2-oxoglutarate dehydrogenase complex dihydrolipoamide acyltransferase (E2) component
MRQRHADARVVPYLKYQRFAAAGARTVRHQQLIHGLLEVNVTGARAALRAYKARTGEALSFTAFIIGCLARAVDEHKSVQAFHYGVRRLILFEDVDVNTRVEREVDGQKLVVPYIIRAANHKMYRQLHDELRAAQTVNPDDLLTRFRVLSFLPAMLYRILAGGVTLLGKWRPRIWKSAMGTVGITAVGMFGDGAGWGIPAAAPTALMLTVGGIGQKQELVDGRLEAREYLCLTLSVDHDLVDGAPAARFAQRLKALIESGYGLDGLAGETAQASAAGASPPAVGAARA